MEEKKEEVLSRLKLLNENGYSFDYWEYMDLEELLEIYGDLTVKSAYFRCLKCDRRIREGKQFMCACKNIVCLFCIDLSFKYNHSTGTETCGLCDN